MKQMEPKKYITDKGVEVYEYGWEFDFDNDFKVGDKVMVCGVGYGISYEYCDGSRIAFETITKINKEKGIITLANGFNYKQDKESSYIYKGYKEINKLNRFKTTQDIDGYFSKTCYDFSRNTISENNIRPRYFLPYTEEQQQRLNKFIEEVKVLDVERKEKELAKQQKQDIYNKYQAVYNEEINPLVEEIEEFKNKLTQKRGETFDRVFCANCKSNCGNRKCAYERQWHQNDYIDENHMYEYENKKYRARPVTECKYFEEK